MTTFSRIQLTCPNCGDFVSHTLLTSTNFYGQDTDFRRLTGGYTPRALQLSTCQRCGFTGDQSDFSGTVPPELAARLNEKIAPFLHDESADSPRRWEYAAMIAIWRGQPDEHVGFHFLNAAWCIKDDGGDAELEVYYRRKAIEHFESCLDGGDDDSDSDGASNRAALTYLVGELYRRVGDTTLAHQWFDRAIAMSAGSADLEWVAELAQQQKTTPQEQR